MRNRLARIIVTCIVAGQLRVQAQELPIGAKVETAQPCHVLAQVEEQLPGPQVQIVELASSEALGVPLGEQDEIAAAVKSKANEEFGSKTYRIMQGKKNGSALDSISDLVAEIAQEEWQNHGYFHAKLSAHAETLRKNPLVHEIVAKLHVEPGAQYALGEITFKTLNSNAIEDFAYLRSLFPIQSGETFSREKVAKGLENLQHAYSDRGYINATSVPYPTVDEQNRVVSFEIDIDEGEQFRVGSINLLGADESLRQELLNTFPVGQIYNESALKEFLRQHPLGFSADDPSHVTRHLDERNATVVITLDARPCDNAQEGQAQASPQ